MAPSGRTANNTTRTKTATTTTRWRTTRRTRQPRRTTHFKKQQQHNTKSKKQETSTTTVLPSTCSSIISSQDSSKEEGDMEISEVIDVSNSNNSACSTPKGQKFRIPEISTCPPAPKKPRVLSNYSLRRSPLSFFSPPDLELFFFVALRDVSV